MKFQKEIILPENGIDLANYTYVKELIKIICYFSTFNSDSAIYNTSTHKPISLFEIIQTISKYCNSSPILNPIPSAFLIEQSIIPRIDIPLWNNGNNFSSDNYKIKSIVPFEFSSFEKSIANTINHYDSLGWRIYSNNFLSKEKERELIENHKIKLT